ncbi:30S ribosomal protein S4 [Nanoarchaeota archaeon]
MGDPRKPKKKFSTPNHPWIKEKIEEDKVLLKEYGMKNKKELWKMASVAKHFAQRVKALNRVDTVQSEKEKKDLFERMKRLGLLGTDSQLEDALALTTKNVLERRLQSIVFRKGLARSVSQARQFIVHNHIKVGEKKINVPSYLVKVAEEVDVVFVPNSSLAFDEHPERAVVEKKEKKKETTKSEEAEDIALKAEEIEAVEEQVTGKS